MTVATVKERFENRRSSKRDGQTTHARVFLVECTDPRDGTATALTANDGTTRIPTFGQSHPTHTAAKVVAIDAEPHGDTALWFIVTVEYSTDEPRPENPLLRPAEYVWGATESTEPYFMDALDRAIVNSAGEPFEQLLERESSEMVVTITRNEADHDAWAAESYSHTINSNTQSIDGTTFAAGLLKMSPIQATKTRENGYTFYRKTYTIKVRRNGWLTQVLDTGFNELIDPDPTDPDVAKVLRPIVDGTTGLPVKNPWPLDGTGRKQPNPDDAPAVGTVQPYTIKDWSPLNL